MQKNSMRLEFSSKSINEGFARVAVASFISILDPTIDTLADIKTAVSEAVTNSIIHGYGHEDGKVIIECTIENNDIEIKVMDEGNGIKNIELAMEPLYTSRPDLERSGMGFTVMETFMDELKVESEYEKGTCVVMRKHIN